MEEYQIALNKAKIALMSKDDSVFLTTVCLSLKMKWDDKMPTAATDGVSIWLNPTFFLEQSPDVRVSILLHESLHVALIHMDRLNTRDKHRFNIAADHVINLMLKERGFTIPDTWYCDAMYTGMGTEQVYELLKDQPAHECSMPDLLAPPMESEELTQAVDEILVRASVQAKMAGNTPGSIPGDIQIYLERLLNPKLPWHSILRKYIGALTKCDYSFRRPNRRHFPDYYLPSLYSEKLIDITIAVDTSGSVSDSDFKSFVSEVNGIFKMMKPNKITLIQFDTNIKSVTNIKTMNDIMNTKFVGRGGTHIGPVLDWALINKPKLLLVFTDGEFRFPQNRDGLKTPVTWLIHNNTHFKAPFGKVINYDLEAA